MKRFCSVCQKEVEHHNWKSSIVNGKSVFVCGRHFKSSYPELIPKQMKESRRRFFKDTIQPYRQGKLSKEYCDAYPYKAKEMASKKEIKQARDTWKGEPGQAEWRRKNPT